MRGVSIENDVTCRIIGRCVHGSKIDRELEDLIPNPPRDPPRLFTYARYDADLGKDGVKDAGVNLKGRRLELDSVWAIDEMERIGEHAAKQVDLAKHFGNLLFD